MKRVIVFLFLAATVGAAAFGQSEWQGRVARGGSQDFPSDGYYAASNSFARNSIVAVTNPATGKSVRVVISRGLSDNSLFMTLSNDAARALGLDGSFPATMKATPVIIPGASDQSIGAETPFTNDPDLNPAASAGDANQSLSSQPLVRSNPDQGQAAAAPRDATAAAALRDAAPRDSGTRLQNAEAKGVPAAADVDLNQTALISDQTLPTELSNQAARPAGSAPPAAAATAEKPLNTLQAASADQVARSDGPEAAAPESAGQAAALPDSSPAEARVATQAGAVDLGAAGQPAQRAVVNPRSAGVAAGVRNAIDAPVEAAPEATAEGGVSRGIASSLRNLRDGAGAAEQAAPVRSARSGAMAAGVNRLGSKGLGQYQAPRGQKAPTVALPKSGGASGVADGARRIDGDRRRPDMGDIARPEHLFSPLDSQSLKPAPVDQGIALPVAKEGPAAAGAADSLLDRQMAAINARAGRPLFTAPKQDGDQALLPSLLASDVPYANPALPAARLRSGKFDPSLAGANSPAGRDAGGALPLANRTAEDNRVDPSLAGASSPAAKGVDGRLPLANAVPGARADAPLPGGVAGRSDGPNAAALPYANAVPGARADAPLPGGVARPGEVADAKLPWATPKGSERPEFSNPYLEGENSLAGVATALPTAQLVPGEIPQASLRGAGPGVALIPEKSDLPLVALDVNQQAQPAFSGLTPTRQSLADAKLPAPANGNAAGPEDPVGALRPVQTVVTLEPAEYRPPTVPAPSSDRILAEAPPAGALNATLSEAKPKTGTLPDAALAGRSAGGGAPLPGDLAAARDPSLPDGSLGLRAPGYVGVPNQLATAGSPPGLNADPLLLAMRPETQNLGAASLAEPRDRGMPELMAAGDRPAPAGVDRNAIANPRSPDAEKLLPGQKPAVGDKGPVAVKPASPGLPRQGKPAPVEPLNRKPEPVKPDAGPADAGESVAVDDLWAQKNLPLVKSLQRSKYYLQVGAFANARSAKAALGDVAPKYPVAVLPEKGAKRSVYKVFIGPLAEDEKGLALYLLRAKGYRDAFIKKTQP